MIPQMPSEEEGAYGSSAPPADLSMLMGGGGGAGGATMTPPGVDQSAAVSPVSPEEQASSLMMQIRQISIQIQGLARQYPAGQQSLMAASDALTQAMTEILVSQSPETGSAPPVLG